jgi:hypothetical protein
MEAVTVRRAQRGAALLLLGTILVSWLVRCSSTDPAPGEGAGSGRASGPVGVVELSGSTSSLISPGSSAPLDLRLTNSASYALVVTRLTVSIHAVDAPRSDAGHPCTPDDFVLRQAPSGLTVRVDARASSTLLELGTSKAEWPRVGMLNSSSNQDGCKGASVDLGYRASATQAPR